MATLKIPAERRNKNTGRAELVRIWGVTDRTVRTWLNDAEARAATDGVRFRNFLPPDDAETTIRAPGRTAAAEAAADIPDHNVGLFILVVAE